MDTLNSTAGTKYRVDLSSSNVNDVRVMAYDLIAPGSEVLDVGCACGDFGALLATKDGMTLSGMEYDADSLAFAEKKGVFAELRQVDLNSFSFAEIPSYKQRFDYITLLDVLEHTMQPERSVVNLLPYLKPQGALIVSIPNVSFGDVKLGLLRDEFNYADTGVLDRTHLRFFTAKTIGDFFSRLGLEIISKQVKVADVTAKSTGVSWAAVRFIRRSPQSYVYQYVLMLKPSRLAVDELTHVNALKMRTGWHDVKKPLSIMRGARFRRLLVNCFLPVNSRRRAFVKSIRERILK